MIFINRPDHNHEVCEPNRDVSRNGVSLVSVRDRTDTDPTIEKRHSGSNPSRKPGFDHQEKQGQTVNRNEVTGQTNKQKEKRTIQKKERNMQ